MNAHEISMTINLYKLFLIAVKSEVLGLYFLNKEMIGEKSKASIQKFIEASSNKGIEIKKIENLYNEIHNEAGKIIVLCTTNENQSVKEELRHLEK